jgi:uncharacterized protein
MITRQVASTLTLLAQQFPVVALLGPRQSDKATLAQSSFSNYRYVSLENSDIRALALNDPRGFLENLTQEIGVILDEFQHVPVLLSYMQTIVDRAYRPGYFILTGSQNFLLNEAITQSLAGRIGIITLLPLSIAELKANNLLPDMLDTCVFNGGYPRIYSQNFTPSVWYPNYIQTYIERDVRQLKNITDLMLFQKFIQLCAGRIGQLLNLVSLSNDCGISVKTTQAWLSVLEASYILFFLQPYYKNFSKRLIKSPKLYFYDTGLACSLLGIESQQQLFGHYLRGGLVESLIISEFKKYFYNSGRVPRVYFWRDSQGHEIDCIIERGLEMIPVEIKAGYTITSDYFVGLDYWYRLTNTTGGFIVYAGPETLKTVRGTLVNWQQSPDIPALSL